MGARVGLTSLETDLEILWQSQGERLKAAFQEALRTFYAGGGTSADCVELIIVLTDGCGSVGAGSLDELDLAPYRIPTGPFVIASGLEDPEG